MTLKPNIALSGQEPLGNSCGIQQSSSEVEEPHDEGVVQGHLVHGFLEAKLQKQSDVYMCERTTPRNIIMELSIEREG
jgi:hypothetical protein